MIACGSRYSVGFGDTWYTADLGGGKADIVRYYGLDQPVAGAQESLEFPTLWIDLTRDQDELLAGMNKSTRHHVRKAAEYGLVYESWFPEVEPVLDEMADFCDASNTAKHLPAIDRGLLRAYCTAGALDLSCIRDSDGRRLVWHGHFRDGSHARQTHTASIFRTCDPEFRNFIGRANRYGCWQDLLRFKRDGLSVYDFGGWYPGTEDKELLAVNFFKEGFGGRLVTTYKCTRAETVKGRVYLTAAHLRRRMAGGRRLGQRQAVGANPD